MGPQWSRKFENTQDLHSLLEFQNGERGRHQLQVRLVQGRHYNAYNIISKTQITLFIPDAILTFVNLKQVSLTKAA